MSFFKATPSVAQTITTENYVSSVDFLSEIHKPDVGEIFVQRYGDQGMTGFIDMMGAKKPVSNKEYIHYEEDWIHQTFVVNDTANDGTIAGGYLLDVDQADDAGTTQDESDYTFIRPNTVVEFENGQVALVVAVSVNGGTWKVAEGYTAVSAAVVGVTMIEVLTYDGTNTGLADIAGGVGIITGTEFGEGTDQPEGLTPNVIKYENTVMIIKEAYEVTGSEATNAIWFKVEDSATGRSGWLWYLKGEADTYQRFSDYAEMQMLVGENVASGATALAGLGIRGTEGLLDFAEGGNSLQYTTTFGVDDFRDLVVALDKNKGSKENTMWSGLSVSLDIDDAFFNYFGGSTGTATGGASFGTFEGGEEKAVQMGFKSFQYGGYTFHKTTYKAFNHTQMLGYETVAGNDSKYRTMSLVVPTDTQIDPKTRERMPSLAIRYKEADGYSREMEHWLEGGALIERKTNGIDKVKSNYRTERGFEGFAPNRYALIEK